MVEFGNSIDKGLVNTVSSLRDHVNVLHEQGYLPGLQETVPTFRSLAIIIDPLITSVSAVRRALIEHPIPNQQNSTNNGKAWRLPVCYASDYGPDLDAVAENTGLSTEEVIAAHLSTSYRVYLLGFQPGYGFLGDTDIRLHLPRRTEPRVRIPAGSVAIAMKLTCVYPWDSPGGWHLLGRCPVPMFDARAKTPTLLSPNDSVRFEAIDKKEFVSLQRDINSGSVNWSTWCDTVAL